MNIGNVAQRSGVPPKTIRYYEAIGLIASAERGPNGYRAYSERDMQALHFIRRARSLGFSVEEVRILLDLWRDKTRSNSDVKALAKRHLGTLDQKIKELQAMRLTLTGLIDRCRGNARPDCPILDELGTTEPGAGASPATREGATVAASGESSSGSRRKAQRVLSNRRAARQS